MTVIQRITTLEGKIQVMIDELALLKVQVGDSTEPLFASSLFDPIPSMTPLKELYVLLDFETGGKFYRLFCFAKLFV